MERFIQIVEERYFPNWNSHRCKIELLRDIIDPIGDFVSIIIDLGLRYNIPRDAHVTFSAIDDTRRALWVNKYKDRPLLHRDLYSNRSNTRMSNNCQFSHYSGLHSMGSSQIFWT